jgi:LacI family gluconate utilization system Gnt-I transcriptional repressor
MTIKQAMTNKKAATFRDIAALAGVSTMTVSRALRGSQLVVPETRDRIKRAARELGYVPNLLAGALSTKQPSQLVGAVVGTLSDATFAQTLSGLTDALGPAGLQLVVGESSFAEPAELGHARTLLGRKVQGLVLASGRHDAALRDLVRKTATPTVEVWDLPPRLINVAVGFSNELVGRIAARYLIERGRRRLAFAGSTFYRDVQRWRGFVREVRDQGLPAPIRFWLGSSGSVYYDALSEGERLIREQFSCRTATVDGLFVCDDTAAIAAVTGAMKIGFEVPRQLSIVGFGNQKLSAHIRPSLTSIDVRAYEIGQIAGEMISNPIQTGRSVDLGVRVCERESA